MPCNYAETTNKINTSTPRRSDSMTRWLTTLFVALLYLCPVRACLERKELLTDNKFLALKVLSFVAAKDDDFRITEKTEVLLDGRPCRYEQVPDGAVIVLLETVSNESKEIARIHFRSPRRPASSPPK
jgi:hypothetical protein